MKFRFLALAAALTATGATAAPRGFTVEDLVTMERVGAPAVSPDGSRVVYTVRTTDMGKNRGHTDLYLIDLRGADRTPQRLTSDAASSTDPEWSPKGDAIYFLSARSGSSQIWRMPVAGGANAITNAAAARVTDLPLDIDAFHVAPTGDRVAFSMSVFRDCADLACTKSRLPRASRTRPPARSTTACSCATGTPGPTAATTCCIRRRWTRPAA